MNNSKRIEEPWNNRLELYIKHMRDTADQQSYLHELSGYHFSTRNNLFGFLYFLEVLNPHWGHYSSGLVLMTEYRLRWWFAHGAVGP